MGGHVSMGGHAGHLRDGLPGLLHRLVGCVDIHWKGATLEFARQQFVIINVAVILGIQVAQQDLHQTGRYSQK